MHGKVWCAVLLNAVGIILMEGGPIRPLCSLLVVCKIQRYCWRIQRLLALHSMQSPVELCLLAMHVQQTQNVLSTKPMKVVSIWH